MARLREKQFYLNNGLLVADKLTRPRLIPIARLNLPLESIFQFFQDNGAVIGPTPNEPVIRAVQADSNPRLFLEHVTKLIGIEGAPRRTPLNAQIMENEFRRKNRAFRPLRQDKALLINTRNLLIMNYNMLNPLYRYIASYRAGYYRWKNNATTFWDSVNRCHERFDWNQYIDLGLPSHLPKYNDFLLMGSGGQSQSNLNKFNTATLLNAYDVFTWLGESRAESSLNALSKQALSKINFIIRAKTHYIVLNLGRLDSWRRDDAVKGDTGLAPQAIQRKFYVLLQGLLEFANGVIPLSAEDDNGERHLDIRDPDEPVVAPEVLPGSAGVEEPVADTEVEESVADEEPDEEAPKPTDTLLPELDLGLDYTPPPEPVQVDSSLDLDDDDDDIPSPTVDTLDDEGKDALYVSEATPVQTDRLTTAVVGKAWEMHELGMLSPAAYRRAQEDASSYTKLPDPFGSGKTIAEAMTYSEEDYKLPPENSFKDTDTVTDKSMLKSGLKGMQQKYVTDLMQKDILNAVLAIQQQGVSVVGYNIETVQDEMNHYQIHSVTIKPLRGRQTTVRFRVPVVDKDGRFISNGVTCRMRLQRGDLPIRKVGPDRVALTSYYNKTFVYRSERVINDYQKWFVRQINQRALDPDDQSIVDPRYTSGMSTEFKLPRIYTLVGRQFRQFTSADTTYFFDWANRQTFFGDDVQGPDQDPNQIYFPVGLKTVSANAPKQVVYVDMNNVFYIASEGGATFTDRLEPLGTLPEILGISTSGAPVEAAVMSVANKTLPVGFVLGYQFGLTKLIESLGAEVSRHQRGERIQLGEDNYALTFQDEVRVFSKLDARATLILSGLSLYHRTLKRFSVYDFDKKDVYFRILEEAELGVRYLREIDTLFQAWVDPITLGILEQMGEPTTFGPLLVRATELLMDDYAPAEIDPAFMRYKGYERISGVVYGEMARAVKAFNNRGGSPENGVEMKQHEIWQRIVQDPTVANVEDSNPIANMREQEAMTYRGDGGRGGASMTEQTRVYHKNDEGTLSESTVDSGDVGVVAYLTPDANFTDMRGLTRPYDPSVDTASKFLSSAAQLAPCADHDDGKRINFIPIQQQQGIYCDGAEPQPVRTGYEQIVAQRTTKLFATSAEQSGEVVAVNGRMIHVRYADGTEARLALGLNHGTAAGVSYPHTLTTQLKAGDTFDKGDTLAYNSKYFTPDRMSPGQVIWKAGVMCNVAMIDNVDTLEDGSAISEAVAKKLNTQTTNIRVVQLGFEQAVHDLVKVGDHVDLDSILCTIVDPEAADQTLFGDAALDTLKRLQHATPRAKVVGTISKIEVFYHGDFEDLSENLQVIAGAADAERRKRAKALGTKPFTGQVDTSFRVKGKSIDPDTLAIKVYIDHDVSAGVGDKGVFANQMKSVFSRTYSGYNKTANGKLEVDAIFGRLSVEARQVHSPTQTGMANMLLHVGGFHIADVFFGDKEPVLAK